MEGEKKHNRKCTGRRIVLLDLRHNLSIFWILSSSPSYTKILPKSHFFLFHSHALEQAVLSSLMKSCFLRPVELFPFCRGFFSSLGLFSTCPISLYLAFMTVQFICSVVSNYLWPHGLQHARLPCPSPTPRACSNSCPSSLWCHPTISSLCLPFSSLQSFPASGSFPMSQFFASLEFQLQHQSFQWIFMTDFL